MEDNGEDEAGDLVHPPRCRPPTLPPSFLHYERVAVNGATKPIPMYPTKDYSPKFVEVVFSQR
jgi:hypothetical protein